MESTTRLADELDVEEVVDDATLLEVLGLGVDGPDVVIGAVQRG